MTKRFNRRVRPTGAGPQCLLRFHRPIELGFSLPRVGPPQEGPIGHRPELCGRARQRRAKSQLAMIHRITREERKHPFVVIDKRPLEDKRLSWKAKGVLAYLLSKPDGWRVDPRHLASVSNCGPESIREALKELARCGYARLEHPRDRNGTLTGSSWTVSELPFCTEMAKTAISVNPTPITEMAVCRNSGKPKLGKPPSQLLSTDKATKNIGSVKNDPRQKNPSLSRAGGVCEFCEFTLENTKTAFRAAGSTDAEANKFFAYYDARGWMMSRSPMRSLESGARNWLNRSDANHQNRPAASKVNGHSPDGNQIRETINVRSL